MNLDFSDIKVLVIGDFMIDHYIIGESNRMSPDSCELDHSSSSKGDSQGSLSLSIEICIMGSTWGCVPR